MNLKKLWTDMHSNIHHNQMDQLEQWVEHAKATLDFWPIAYYPFYMRKTAAGAGLEDTYAQESLEQDWEMIREITKKVNQDGYPMFMGYEWQGSGEDGDHNVFFLDNNQKMKFPMRYQELKQEYENQEAIAIPHHVSYQLGSRGKNWDTHDEKFSPFAEIYSSHGCSETDTGLLGMDRHIHMGPRTGETCYERGLEKGYRVGIIASGDNHKLPGVYDHGTMCVLAESNTKEAIWEAMKARRVYGVSKNRIEVDFRIDGQEMGGVVLPGKGILDIQVKASDAIDRIEILKDNILDDMVVHSGTWERNEHTGIFKVKFAVEFGWGPKPTFYKDQLKKEWKGSLEVPGRICSIEKCWNSFGQRLYDVTEKSCKFDLTTYMSTATGHWMGPSVVVREGFIFEVEGKMNDEIILKVDDYEYQLKIQDLLYTSRILPQYKESVALAQEVFGDEEHYRDDFYWHNAHKTRIRQAVPEEAYTLSFQKELLLEPGSNYRLRVWQKNGDVAWTSPIFVEKEAQ